MLGRPVIGVLVGEHHGDEIAEIEQRIGEIPRIDHEGLPTFADREAGVFVFGHSHDPSQPRTRSAGNLRAKQKSRPCRTGSFSL
ncbi:hypothetical protein GCM10025738_05580 [Microbacterium fluvii]